MATKKNKSKSTQVNPTLEKKNGGKKLKPLVRNVILIDLVVLSAVQLAVNSGELTSGISEVITVLGFVVMMIALGIQFEQISLNQLYVGANFTKLKQDLTTPQPAKPKKKKNADDQREDPQPEEVQPEDVPEDVPEETPEESVEEAEK